MATVLEKGFTAKPHSDLFFRFVVERRHGCQHHLVRRFKAQVADRNPALVSAVPQRELAVKAKLY